MWFVLGLFLVLLFSDAIIEGILILTGLLAVVFCALVIAVVAPLQVLAASFRKGSDVRSERDG